MVRYYKVPPAGHDSLEQFCAEELHGNLRIQVSVKQSPCSGIFFHAMSDFFKKTEILLAQNMPL